MKTEKLFTLLLVTLLWLSAQSFVYGQDSAKSYNDAGDAAYKRNDFQTALTNYKEASRIAPQNALYHINVGTTLNRLLRFEEAATELREGVRLNSSVAWFHNELCTALMVLERQSEAAPHCREAIRLDSNYADFQPKLIQNLRDAKAAASKINVRLVSDIWCQNNTDDGAAEDELYFIVAGKKSNGETIEGRLPGDNHWSIECHNRGNNRLLRDITLWQGALVANESIELTIITMEQDRGDVPAALKVALEVAKRTVNDPEIGTALRIASFIITTFGNNRDDFTGAVAVRLTNSNGDLKAEWAAKEYAEDKGFEEGKKKFHLTNDGEFHFRLWTVK